MYTAPTPFGYDESVLASDEDFEPYGFGSPHLAEAAWEPAAAPRPGTFSQVIEAALLAEIK